MPVGWAVILALGLWIIRIIRQSAKDDLRQAIAEKDRVGMAEAAKGVYRANEAHERRLRAIHNDPSDADLSRMLSTPPGDPKTSTPAGS